MRSILLAAALVASLLAVTPARADWLPGYDSGAFTGGDPRCAVEFEGRLVIGGTFNGAGCTSSARVIQTDFERYYAMPGYLDGSGTVSPAVNALVVYDGQIVAGGAFSGYWSPRYVNIARHDGVRWSPLGASLEESGLYGGPVTDLVVFEGDLIAVGDFVSSGIGVVLGGIARWDGSAWQPMGVRPAGARALGVYEGELYCGLSRWDGGDWVSLGTLGPSGRLVTALDVVDEGLAVGGTFETIDGGTFDGTALIDATGLHAFGGGAWTDALPGSGLTERDFPGVGGFASFNGQTWMLAPRYQINPWRYGMVSRLDTSSGSYRWLAVEEIGIGYVGRLYGGALLAVGDRIVALADTRWYEMDVEGAPMRSALVLRDGAWSGLVPGRGFTTVPQAVAHGAGGTWFALGDDGLVLQTDDAFRREGFARYLDLAPAPLGIVAVGAAPYGGDIGGNYAFISEHASESESAFLQISGWFGVELARAVLPWQGGYLLAVEANYGVPFSDGIGFVPEDILQHQWTFMATVPVPESPVDVMAVHQEHPWYASAGQLFRIDGTPDTGLSQVLVATFNGPVDALVSDGDQLLVGGDFDSVNAMPVRNLAAWDGSQWSEPFVVDGPVHALAVDELGVVYVGGNFWTFAGQRTSRLAVFRDGAIGTFAIGPDGPVTDLALTDEGFVITGDFATVAGECANHVAEWSGRGESVGIQGRPGDGDTPRITQLRMLSPSPNPFNPRVTLAFELPSPAAVQLRVYDLSGRLVRTVVAEDRGPGRHEFTWDGMDAAGQPVSSGVYLAVLDADGRRETVKMALVR